MQKLDFLTLLTVAMRETPAEKTFASCEFANGNPLPRDAALSKLRYVLFDFAIDAGISTDNTSKELDTLIYG